ncbi:hypothetical protein [Chiayiivirga flava]|uniref:Uncharacterized protein n=1 Tax=Chiayiivirga flava TaxID=659595 RepID=A0A7W8D5I1_9GAMM|nr:hypothetical protein [Chiayiivirga flava]MBB5207165.1 hypothetical protein [Chiayiivirga flava]
MNRILSIAAIALTLVAVTACNKTEEAAAPVAAAPAPLSAPAAGDNQAWKLYLVQVAKQNMEGIRNSPYMYYLPAASAADFEDQYTRQLDNVTDTVARGVLPGNMLAFGSPESTRMGDLIVEAFKGAEPASMKDVRVLFIGAAADAERAKAAVEPTGATFVFSEAK